MVHVLLKLGLENFEHYFASLWDKCGNFNYFALNFFRIGMKLIFSSLVATAEISKLAGL